MKKEDQWSIFELTGDVRDYLSYTACTKEDRTYDLDHTYELSFVTENQIETVS